MENAINGIVFDLVAETARETSTLEGLETLKELVYKLEHRTGLTTQTDRLCRAKGQIEARWKELQKT